MPARSVQASRSPSKVARRAAVRRRQQAPSASRSRSGSRGKRSPELPAPVSGVLARFGRALAAGDLPSVSACFAYPSLYLTGADTHEFRDPLQVETVFREFLKANAEAGVGALTLKVEHASDLGHGIYACTVHWRGGERAHVIVQESAVGTALIRAAVAVS